MRKRTLLFTICALAMIANTNSGPSARAQEQEKKEERAKTITQAQNLVFQNTIAGDPTAQGPNSIESITPLLFSGLPGDSFLTLASEMNYERKVIKGAPFSADAMTEFVQGLADGNRILRTTSGSMARDAEGRTRREQIQPSFGSQAPAGNPEMFRTIVISDPVGNLTYTLQPFSHTAFKHPRYDAGSGVSSFTLSAVSSATNQKSENISGREPQDRVVMFRRAQTSPDAAKSAKETNQFVINGATFGSAVASGEGQAAAPVATIGALNQLPPVLPRMYANGVAGGGSGDIKQESLGRQTIEGVEVVGTRSTYTLPIGAVGNERPIEVVYERWVSPELQVLVMARHNDPRVGETVYRLTNINRAAPDASLFQIPADYKVHEFPSYMGPASESRKNKDQ